MISLRCPVRGCPEPLVRTGSAFRCAKDHSFDLARSGYLNLLQPQDKKSKAPGDSAEATSARQRFLSQGFERHLEDALRGLLPKSGATLLDVGCGEGHFLRAVASGLECCGVDLSASALTVAAREQKDALFIVTNADREMPFIDGAFDVVLSINAPFDAPEIARVLRPGGRLVVVIPASDDLVEVRALVLGEGADRDRMPRLRNELEDRFVEVSARRVSRVMRLSSDDAKDALTMTYRGMRMSQRTKVDEITDMNVTISHELSEWTPRVGESPD